MNKNVKKILINTLKILVIVVLVFFIFKTTVNADGVGNPIDNPESYNITGDDKNTDDVQKIIGQILTIVNIVGAAVAVGTFAIIAIKYILGSVEERADYKKSMTPYLFGAFFLFSASTIVNIIYNVGKKIF